jgi:hypothetical protein
MFCVVTAPTPARAYAQRAATAGEEEATAAANCPVRGHRAASEKVMCGCALFETTERRILLFLKKKKQKDLCLFACVAYSRTWIWGM